MLFTTTAILQDRKIEKYLGIVSCNRVIGANRLRDFTASFRDFFGGRVQAYETVFTEGRTICLKDLEKQAHALGANGIIGLSLEFKVIGRYGSIMLVAATGTAVQISDLKD
jgi:uncharacterized protein YbjQ (UPF0145 family)